VLVLDAACPFLERPGRGGRRDRGTSLLPSPSHPGDLSSTPGAGAERKNMLQMDPSSKARRGSMVCTIVLSWPASCWLSRVKSTERSYRCFTWPASEPPRPVEGVIVGAAAMPRVFPGIAG